MKQAYTNEVVLYKKKKKKSLGKQKEGYKNI